MDQFDAILAAISAVGFPIVITFYVLIRLQTTMDKVATELEQLVNLIEHKY